MIKIQTSRIFSKINFENIFILYIIIQPIIDLITSLCVRNISEKLTLGIFIRTIFMMFIMIYVILKVDKKSRWQILVYYSCIAIYCILFIINCYTKYGFSMIFTQIKGLVKTFYFPIILASLLMLFKNKKYSIKYKYLNIALLLYVLPIVICKFFSIGYETYQHKATLGTVGLFYAGNEIGAIVSLLSPICFAKFISEKFNVLNFLTCIFTVLAMLEIGTKVSSLSIIMLLALALIVSFVKFIKDKKIYKQFISIFLLVILTIIFIGNTSGGSNLNIKPLIFKNTTSSTKEKKPNTHNNISKNKVIENPEVLLSGRNKFFKKTLNKYTESSVSDKLVGIGYIGPKKGEIAENKLVEIDYFDIFFNHGIIGTLIFMAPLLIAVFIIIKGFFGNFIANLNNSDLIFVLYSIALGFGIALLAGHVFTAPAVSFCLAIMINKSIDILRN